MLFPSNAFLLEFLPAMLAGFFLIKRFLGPRAAQAWLALASLVFYATAGASLLLPLALSIAINFLFGRMLSRRAARGQGTRVLLAAGVAADLGLLFYFKYMNFFAANLAALGLPVETTGIALPLGISFYTFTQIAFLVDAARGQAAEYGFLRYVLFVTFFPHLIAGPIIHHKEMMPQLAPETLSDRKFDDLPQAFLLFAIGLAKKVLLADSFERLASPVFAAAAHHAAPDLIAAWGGMLAYTFQIYFDFSGYSDMALGLALMFGVRLPVNFLSPYKATSIIEFWRTWHMTLSRFLKDYLYIPLGGNRHGAVRRYANLLVVMTFGGLWHGAGWTFVLWGALHGVYLLINHAWRAVAGRSIPLSPAFSRAITFLAIALAWVLFRADSVDTARAVYAGLLGQNGIVVAAEVLAAFGVHGTAHVLGVAVAPLYGEQTTQWLLLGLALLGFAVCWGLPNSMELCGFAPAPATRLSQRLAFRLAPRYAVATAVMLFASIDAINTGAVSAFIYYRF
jgi:alginate O-acetyltransferase complex protein AlgI